MRCYGARSGAAGAASFDEPAVATLADMGAVTDDRAAADKYRADGTAELEALVWRVVAGVVELACPQRPPRGWVEQDEVGIPPDLDCALALEPEQACGRRGEQVDHPLERESRFCHAFAVRDRKQRLDARRAVTGPIECDAPPRQGFDWPGWP